MKYMIRIAAVVLVFPAAQYFSYWIFAAILFSAAGEESFSTALHGIVIALSLTTSTVSSVYTWKKAPLKAPRDMLSTVLLGALILGSVGFIGGFFGPIFLGGGNQGPLLGIFITGPLGFVIGALGGLIAWFVRRTKHTSSTPA